MLNIHILFSINCVHKNTFLKIIAVSGCLSTIIAREIYLPRLVQNSRQLVQDVDLQRCDLAHDLRGQQQFVLGDGFAAMATGGAQIDALNELHVVQQRIEGHEIGEADAMTLGHLE